MEKVKVLVVDDSLFIRQILTDILNDDSHITVAAQAGDGIEALQKMSEMTIDVVTLDLDMPNLDGLATLNRIMQMSHPPAVIIVSSYTQEGAVVTLSCLEAGAVDFVLKFPGSASGELQKLAPEIIKKVKIASTVNTEKLKNLYSRTQVTPTPPKEKKHEIVVIGSSTGGTVALERILPALPTDFSVPVLIAQHLPEKFVESLTNILQGTCKLSVVVVKEGDRLLPGKIYFAPGGSHTEIHKNETGEVYFTVAESSDILTPSIDKLMLSAAKVYGENTIGVILTGMGHDGMAGMKLIKESHGKTIVQDEASSVVFGMGKEVVEAGLADDIVPLDQIISHIIEESR